MKKVAWYGGCTVIVLLALYGAFHLILQGIGQSQGPKAVELMTPIVQKAAVGVGQQAKEAILQYPNEQLERDGEDVGRKFYHLHKGVMKGLMEELRNDPQREMIRQQAYELGQEFSKSFVKPFTRGLAEGSRDALEDLHKTLEGPVQRLGQEGQGLAQIITGIIDAIRRGQMGPAGAPSPRQPSYPPYYSPAPSPYPQYPGDDSSR